jgi:hypothetical protein
MTKSEYAQYLQSEHWRELRKEVLREFPFCEKCKLPRWLAAIAYDQDLNLHHLTYANLGEEDWTDLEVLCRRCHDIETFGRSDLRAVKRSKCQACFRSHYDPYVDLCDRCNIAFKDLPEFYELLALKYNGTFAAGNALEALVHQFIADGETPKTIAAVVTKLAEQELEEEIPF